MAITATIPTNLNFPNRGELERDAFVLAQETAQDLLAGTFTTNMNLFATQANALEVNVNNLELSALNSSLQALNYSNSALSYSNTAKTYRDTALTYQTGAQLAYSNTQTLLNTLVIPTTATYSYAEADAKFVSQTEQFLNFKIGE